MSTNAAPLDFVRVRSLIENAAERGVVLSVEGDRLKYSAPGGQIPAGLREDLRSLRQSVTAELSQPVFKERRQKFTRVTLPACFDGFWQETRASQSLASSTHVILKLTGSSTLEHLRAALEDIVARHDLLRARFAIAAGPPALVFDAESAPSVEVLDVSGSTDARARADALIERTIWAPFGNGPVFRVCLIQLARAEFLVAFVLHHIVADFRSCEIVAIELLLRVAQPDTASLTSRPRPIQFADYLAGLGEWLAGPAIPYREAFWKQKMLRAPSVRLPPDHESDADLPGRADLQERVEHPGRVELLQFSVTPELRARMARAAASCKVALFAALLAAQFAALWATLRQRDLLIAAVVSGRDAPALAGLVGNTIDCVPIRIAVDANMTLGQLVQEVREADFLARSYHIPRTLLVESLREVESTLVAPLFNLMISSPTPDLGTSAIRAQPVAFAAPQRTAGTDWKGHELHMYDLATSMRGLVNYAPGCYRKRTIVSFLETMFYWLEALARRPQDTLALWRDEVQSGQPCCRGLEIS